MDVIDLKNEDDRKKICIFSILFIFNRNPSTHVGNYRQKTEIIFIKINIAMRKFCLKKPFRKHSHTSQIYLLCVITIAKAL